jgi:hypothetical protein
MGPLEIEAATVTPVGVVHGALVDLPPAETSRDCRSGARSVGQRLISGHLPNGPPGPPRKEGSENLFGLVIRAG